MGQSQTTGVAEQTGGLSKDEMFTLLKNCRRREVLRRLRRNDGELSHRELAEGIAAAENDVTEDQLTSKQRKRVYISLYQSHLPTLADAGVVEYDANRGTVEMRPPARDCLEYLDRLDEPAESRPRLDRLWGFAGAVVGIASLLTVPASVPSVLGLVVSAGFLTVFCIQSIR